MNKILGGYDSMMGIIERCPVCLKPIRPKDLCICVKNPKWSPSLPIRVKHCMGLYTKINSDLFIDDLSPTELRQIADHMEWYDKTCGNKNMDDAPDYERDNHE